MYIYICLFAYMGMCKHVHPCVYVFSADVYVNVLGSLYIVYVYVNIYIYMYVCMYECMHTYICTYMQICRS